MKTHVTLIMLFGLWLNVMAQTPVKINYETMIREINGKLSTNQIITSELTILEDTLSGNSFYQEIHIPSYDGQLIKNTLSSHFIPTGDRTEAMNIYLLEAKLDGTDLSEGDEVGIFDGNICAGAFILTQGLGTVSDTMTGPAIAYSSYYNITGGFTPGHTISYRFWDQSLQKEIANVAVTCYNNQVIRINCQFFEAGASAFVQLFGYSTETIEIPFRSGWGMFSSNVIPPAEDADLKDLFLPFIHDSSLIKVQDENGNSLEDLGNLGGWVNNIGILSPTEGYKIKVNRNCTIKITGSPVGIPLNIPLKEGWNIIGYPGQTEMDGKVIIRQLIKRGTLNKVQDERGISIEDYGVFGGWTNNIGNLKPGKGYKVKVSANDTLTADFSLASVTTAFPDSATENSVILGGEVTCDGGSEVTERGVFFSVTRAPTPGGTKIVLGSGMGIFKLKVTGLSAKTTYYAWSYAVNHTGTAFGNQVAFTTSAGNPTGTFIDSRDGKTYKWVKIGYQIWMAENLAWLPAVSPPANSSDTEKYYYVYDYSGTDVSAARATGIYLTYGVLYNWAAAINDAAGSSANPSGVQGACPSGWHLPSDTEWTTLTDYLINNGYGWQGSGNDIAKSMASPTNWNYLSAQGFPGNDPACNNSSGFSGLPGGLRDINSTFLGIGDGGFWWSSTENSVINAWSRILYYSTTSVSRGNHGKTYGLSIRCVRDGLSVTTATPDSITSHSVILGGEVTNDGGLTVEERGLCFATTQSPTTADTKVVMGSGTGKFSVKIKGLTANTTYYVRAYAISIGTIYGNPEVFVTSNGTVTDVEGNLYQTVQIGSQIWMRENLKTATYNDSTAIPLVTDSITWANLTTPGYCWYNNDKETYGNTYGALYNWYAVNTEKLCPSGWHVPSDAEWASMTTFIGGESVAGGKMKKTGTAYWLGLNTGATDESGFSGLPGGYRNILNFSHVGFSGSWWSSTEYSTTSGWARNLWCNSTSVDRFYIYEKYGFSARCIKYDFSVTTDAPDSITTYSVILGGEVLDDGGYTVTERGICYGTTQMPTIESKKVTIGSGKGAYKCKVTGFESNTVYYIRAYATNSRGTAYGQQRVFKTMTGIAGDADGNNYYTVTIGTQVWMAENLKTTKYNDGISIPLITGGTNWGNLTTPGYCWYNDDQVTYGNEFGALYNLYTVNTGKLCPVGWHVPSDAEWTTLKKYLINNGYGYQGSGEDIAKSMASTTYWYYAGDPGVPGNDPASNNSSGFSGLPGGARSEVHFSNIGTDGWWWSSTESITDHFWVWSLNSCTAATGHSRAGKECGFSVRCMRD